MTYGAYPSMAAYSIMDYKSPAHAVSDPSAWAIMMDMQYDEIIELMIQYPTPTQKSSNVGQTDSSGCARINDQAKVNGNG